MALFTIILNFRERQTTFQVRAGSPTAAVRTWAESLDTKVVREFGELSKSRLIEWLEREGVNASEVLPGVWHWVANISGYTTSIVIVATDNTVT